VHSFHKGVHVCVCVFEGRGWKPFNAQWSSGTAPQCKEEEKKTQKHCKQTKKKKKKHRNTEERNSGAVKVELYVHRSRQHRRNPSPVGRRAGLAPVEPLYSSTMFTFHFQAPPTVIHDVCDQLGTKSAENRRKSVSLRIAHKTKRGGA
jgi:hypothetical protein